MVSLFNHTAGGVSVPLRGSEVETVLDAGGFGELNRVSVPFRGKRSETLSFGRIEFHPLSRVSVPFRGKRSETIRGMDAVDCSSNDCFRPLSG